MDDEIKGAMHSVFLIFADLAHNWYIKYRLARTGEERAAAVRVQHVFADEAKKHDALCWGKMW